MVYSLERMSGGIGAVDVIVSRDRVRGKRRRRRGRRRKKMMMMMMRLAFSSSNSSKRDELEREEEEETARPVITGITFLEWAGLSSPLSPSPPTLLRF